jgi:hypothetical protein
MFLGSKVRPLRGADNLTAIYEPIVQSLDNVGILNISQPHRPPRLVTRIALNICSFVRQCNTRVTFSVESTNIQC